MLHRNLGLKLFALLIGIVLWFYVISTDAERRPEKRTLGLPLKVIGLRSGLTCSGAPKKVEASVMGLKRDLSKLDDDAIQARIDLAGLEPGRHQVAVGVEVPRSVVRLGTKPRRVMVEVERIVEESRRVAVALRGAPPPEYRLGKPEVLPSQVEVKGAASAVDQVERVSAVADSREQHLGRPQVAEVKAVSRLGEQVQGVEVKPRLVQITLPAQPVSASRTVPVLPRLKGAPSPGRRVARLLVEPAEVKVSGSPAELRRVNWVETSEVSIDGASSDVITSVPLNLPQVVTAATPRSVRVHVFIEGESAAPPSRDSRGG